MNQHRDSQKRYYEENSVYFIVTKTFQNFPYFKEPMFCELFVEELKLCKELKKFKLYGFCVIYDHLNLLIHPNEEFNISKIMFSIKKQFSHNANRIMGYNELLHNEGEQTLVRLRYGGAADDKNKLINNHHKIVHNFTINSSKNKGKTKSSFQNSNGKNRIMIILSETKRILNIITITRFIIFKNINCLTIGNIRV